MSGLRKAWLDLLSQDSGGAGDPNTKSVQSTSHAAYLGYIFQSKSIGLG